ncbi:hypothetical protein GXP67_18665 [Rhodocytophaga rosea]|uniref:TonB C-terminal domain-containing protein n=1 Tax=Rhodocytophaga rosea TaxID=2704465 RepID=A0A6C0GKM1_9BACT|nr:energy transducer TonB [Rhodocytophaga rosea]QHT68519.1 hypothetical protein GXP67_18665 [Rhodocytophaga rosea]
MNQSSCKYQISILLISMLVSIASELYSQDFHNIDQRDTTIYLSVDSYPKLITLEREYEISNLSAFVNQHLKWPRTSLDCEGRVFISFIVEKNGSLSNKKFAKRLCEGFDEKAMDVIDLMNTWQPGIINGAPVRTLVTIPIKFSL